jgi:hypothetical protein
LSVKPTSPAVFFDAASGLYTAIFTDKKTGREWGRGQAKNRAHAIAAARKNQPTTERIKYVIGWVERHPFIAGAVVGAYLGFRKGRQHGVHLPITDMLIPAVALGALAWCVRRFL